MQKLDMLTPDMVAQNIDAIAQLFPNIITEQEDIDGNITKAIDYDLFRQMFSRELVEGSDERYRLDWPGKRASILKANTPIDKTLRPVVTDSMNWDTTENLYIEGDNFEVLKVLQESYLGKVKMIYIDPPYNTGKDFVYTDNFKISKEAYEEGLEIIDEEGGKLVKNTDTNGRFHSDWLSMMYERLIVARDLLRDDGVIFMSIDDNEVHNFRKIADDIFGEENFRNQIIISRNTSEQTEYAKALNIQKEYILIYSKMEKFVFADVIIPFSQEAIDIVKILNDSGTKKKYVQFCEKQFKLNSGKTEWKGFYTAKEARPSMQYSIEGILPYSSDNPIRRWIWGEPRARKAIENYKIYLSKGGTEEINNILSYAELNNIFDFVRKSKSGSIQYLKFGKEGSVIGDDWSDETTATGSSYLKELFGSNYFDNPKPVSLIKRIIDLVSVIDTNDLILDFFSGSATTAQAVMQLNAEDGGNRKFIMVQIPEETDKDSEAHKAGYPNICEIGKERIRRAGKKIIEENKDKEGIEKLDIGFRVYRLDNSNMKDVYYHPTEVTQAGLFDLTSNIKDDRTPEDILAQVMLDLGLTLDLPIETRTIAGSTVFLVAGNSLVACFDEDVDFTIVDELARLTPLKVVFRDSSFRSDADRINFETRFKKLSPDSDLRVI